MTWPKKLTKTNTKTKTKTNTKTKTFWELLLRAILETCDLWDICSEWWEDMTWPKKLTKTNTKTKTMRTPPKSNPRNLWHLRHWLQFWQLRTWIHDNLCDLTINCDTGQHSQFLRCFYLFMRFMRFEIFIRIKRLICMKGILTLTHGQH